MSFLNKIKQGLGFGTLEAKLNVPGQIAGNSGQFEGDFILTAKSNQQIKEVWVKFEKVRHWDETKHRRDSNGHQVSFTSHESQTFELGNYIEKTPFEMKASEVKTIHFTIPFQVINPQSPADSAIAQGGVSAVLGTITKLASSLRNERVDYRVEGKVDLKDVAFDPKDSKDILVM
ncbi:MAG TPA: hypothetical protein VII97_10330 [Anaerolineales bacterium]